MNSPHRVFNLDAMTVALAGDPDTRAKLTADYGLRETTSADDFVGTLIEAFDQVPIDNPVVLDRPPSDYFKAAVRALGSNSRNWTTFVVDLTERPRRAGRIQCLLSYACRRCSMRAAASWPAGGGGMARSRRGIGCWNRGDRTGGIGLRAPGREAGAGVTGRVRPR